jgi:hypothetical protein
MTERIRYTMSSGFMRYPSSLPLFSAFTAQDSSRDLDEWDHTTLPVRRSTWSKP